MIQLRTDKLRILVLEPGNFRKLKLGQPIPLGIEEGVSELLITYSPDVEWVTKEVCKVTDGSAEKIAEIIQQSLTRPEVDRTGTPRHEPVIKNFRQ